MTRFSPLPQVLATFVVAGLLALLPASVAEAQGDKENHAKLSLETVIIFAGSFLGTTTFWLVFDCDFLRKKKVIKLEERDDKLEEKLSESLEKYNSLNKIIKKFSNKNGKLEEALEKFLEKFDGLEKRIAVSVESNKTDQETGPKSPPPTSETKNDEA